MLQVMQGSMCIP